MANLSIVNDQVSTLTIEKDNITLGIVVNNANLTLSNSGTKGQTGDAGINEWGTILGNLADQTDLQIVLDSKVSETDYNIIAKVGNTLKAFSKTGNLVTGIAYSDAEGATSHSTIYAWGLVSGKNAVTSRVEVFTYESQLWTYTQAFTYPTNDAGAPTITPSITKV